jgi:predicted nucleic acid-binding protein
VVVADTSPLNYLVWIDSVEILPTVYESVAIPPEVHAELLVVDAPAMVRSWANSLPVWVDVLTPDPQLRDDPRWLSLHSGERAALALAAARQPSILLIDERAGARIARAQGFPAIGTLGVLDEAARRHLISLPDMIGRLKRTSFRYPESVVKRLLEEDTQRRFDRDI